MRLNSIDGLRGLIMVVMALDHVRDFFSNATVRAEDLTQTFPALFFTRWITHFCAPGFVLLAGIAAYLYGHRQQSKAALSKFLWTRGLWLIVLELTLVGWGWSFNFGFGFAALQVIWALGISMVILSGLIWLPWQVVTAIGVFIIVGHNALDGVSFGSPQSEGGLAARWPALLWAFLHQPSFFQLGNMGFFTLYSIIPWCGVMAAGYGLGRLYVLDATTRRRWLVLLGGGSILAFLALRLPNLYGEPNPWAEQKNALFSFMSFLNTSKYPASLHYLLMTLGPLILLLAALEAVPRLAAGWLVTLGRVPLFYYLLHLYLIHLAAGLTSLALGRVDHAKWILTNGFNGERPENYGFPLWGVYLAWIAIVAILYPACRWYAGVKQRSKNPWLSYL